VHLRVVLGRAHTHACDAIVRPLAKPVLVAHRPDEVLTAAGDDLLADLRRMAAAGTRPTDARAVVTTAGLLPARFLIHVLVPAFSQAEDREYLLSRAYRAVLAAADQAGSRSLVMPPLGTTGPYWPLDDVARLTVGTLRTTPTGVRDVMLALPTPTALERFSEAIARA
jgi:O-acetyl-ADP-ribose deacetylase (regulator of RNase III)